MDDKKKNQVGAAVSNNSTAGDNDAGLKKRIALFRILQVLKKHSSKEKPLIQEEIVKWLWSDHLFELERKAVGRGLRDLMDAGFNIKTSPRKGYYIDEGISDIVKEYGDEPFPGFDFYDNELFFLLSCISGSPDISDEKANELGNKIANLGNKAFRKAAGKRFIRKDTSGQNDYHTASDNLKTLNAAIEALKEVRFKYHGYKLNKKNFSGYEIIRDEDLFENIRLRPMDLVFAGGKSFLIGKKPDSSDLEVYRLDRMSNLVTLNNSFPCATTEEKDALADFKNKHPFMHGGNVSRVTLKVSPDILPEVADSFGSEISFEGKAGSFIHLSVKASEEEIISWALKNAGKAEVMYPFNLRNKIRDLIDEAQKKYVRLDRIIPRERENNTRKYLSQLIKKDLAVDNSQHQLDDKDYSVVFLENNNLRNVSFLQFYDSLKDLTIINNPVSSITLRSCRLKSLELSQTGVERITFERNLSDLEELVLFDNPIVDYSFLYNLRHLRRLMFDRKAAEKTDIERIKRLNPGIEILVEEKHWREKLKGLWLPDPYGVNKWLSEEQIHEKGESRKKLSSFLKSLPEEQADLFTREEKEAQLRNRNLARRPLRKLKFGEYPQNDTSEVTKEPIEWLVLDENDDELLIMSKTALAPGSICTSSDQKPFTWENSDLRKWLNNIFYDRAFSKKEKSAIIKSNLVTELEHTDGGTELSKTSDNIFILSSREFNNYRRYFDVPRCELTPYAEAVCSEDFDRSGNDLYSPFYCDWWLRTSVDGINFTICEAKSHEIEDIYALENAVGVRPAIRIKKTAEIVSRIEHVKPSPDITPDNFDFSSYMERRYNRGKALFDMGAYYKSLKYFYLFDYKDSGDLFRKARELYLNLSYSEAMDDIANEDYEQGYKTLKDLGYDAVIVDNKYKRALKFIEEGDKANAARLLFNLNFKESNRLLFESERDSLKGAKPGDTVVFGGYLTGSFTKPSDDKAPLEWKVLAREGNKLLVTTVNLPDAKPFDETGSEAVTWKTCSLRKWLNESFYNEAFTPRERAMISKAKVVTMPYGQQDAEEEVTLDRIFLLSVEECKKYFADKADMVTPPSDLAIGTSGICDSADVNEDGAILLSYSYWLRTCTPDIGCVSTVYVDGFIEMDAADADRTDILVRPAMWVEIK